MPEGKPEQPATTEPTVSSTVASENTVLQDDIQNKNESVTSSSSSVFSEVSSPNTESTAHELSSDVP
ncbi:hypothetical protein [Hydrogeniiclostridium mannosilyticum]|uniref:hypothetical protein n=1 Tax=Hydrogeniiclostridium mannosilyticum TaxID=2764322 RepID=UPI0011BECDEE|nr:hypothetical protein [Hydrogeniiclostridium mannosilyticum]